MADGTGRDGFGSLCHAIALRTAHRIIMLPLCKGGRNDDEDPLYLLGVHIEETRRPKTNAALRRPPHSRL